MLVYRSHATLIPQCASSHAGVTFICILTVNFTCVLFNIIPLSYNMKYAYVFLYLSLTFQPNAATLIHRISSNRFPLVRCLVSSAYDFKP
jgi:hypothetical protein